MELKLSDFFVNQISGVLFILLYEIWSEFWLLFYHLRFYFLKKKSANKIIIIFFKFCWMYYFWSNAILKWEVFQVTLPTSS